jgi:hypothetical protein
MAVIKCTNCGAVLKPKDPIAPGKKVKCPKCLQAFIVQADETDTPAQPATIPPPPPMQDAEEPFGEGIGAPEPKQGKGKRDDLNFGDDDETPTRKGKGGGRRDDDDGDDDRGKKKGKGGDAPKKSNTLLIVGIIVGVLLLCCCCGGGGSIFMSGDFQKAFQEELKKQQKK